MPKPYYYDPQRSASLGRWVVITKGQSVIRLEGYHTEAEARKEAGLKGGNTDPRYRP